MNNNAVISNQETNKKKGIKSRLFIPRVTFLEQNITYSVNKYWTVCGNFDILSHIMDRKKCLKFCRNIYYPKER